MGLLITRPQNLIEFFLIVFALVVTITDNFNEWHYRMLYMKEQ